MMRENIKNILKNILSYALIITCVISQPLSVEAYANESRTECHAISVAIDVSGSMKKTDSQKHSMELMKLFMDLCNETDYFNVTAYNDQIVYHSGLVSMGNAAGKEAVMKELDQLQFGGETDNGLGLLTATNAIVESDLEYDSAFIILITDGNTDLQNSKTDRTMEDSNADMEKSAALAKEHDITINVVDYTDAYNQDTGLLSVICASTGGGATIVDNAPQFIQVLLGIFFSEYAQGKASLQIMESEEYLNRYQSWGEVSDCEVTNSTDSIIVHRGKHYLVQEIIEPGNYEFRTVYSVEEPTVIVAGTVKLELAPETEQEVVEVVDTGTAPSREDISQEVDIPDNVSAMDVVPMWKQYYNVIVSAIICVIILCAIGISVYIIRKLLFAGKKEQKAITGYLQACFIDLKSKNESIDIQWNLAEYPPEGVTLEELLLSKRIKENFKDVDKVCFYPGKHYNELLLVHCMEGGVFLGEQIVKVNTPITICSGDVLYISFAENASEIELRYTASTYMDMKA